MLAATIITLLPLSRITAHLFAIESRFFQEILTPLPVGESLTASDEVQGAKNPGLRWMFLCHETFGDGHENVFEGRVLVVEGS